MIPLATNIKQAFSEVDQYLETIPVEQKNKVTESLRILFRENKDTEYTKEIDPSIPIKNQGLKIESLAIISYLDLKYWCEDEKEIVKLQKIYSKSEKAYKEMFKLINDTGEFYIEETEHIIPGEMIAYKKFFIKRFIYKIWNFFKRKKK